VGCEVEGNIVNDVAGVGMTKIEVGSDIVNAIETVVGRNIVGVVETDVGGNIVGVAKSRRRQHHGCG